MDNSSFVNRLAYWFFSNYCIFLQKNNRLILHLDNQSHTVLQITLTLMEEVLDQNIGGLYYFV